MSYQENLARFVELDNAQRTLKAELKAIETEKSELEKTLLDQFVDMGQAQTKINGTTIYIHRQWWAGAAKDPNGDSDYALTCNALIEAGLNDFVQPRFNAQTLSAWVRELPRDEIGVPTLPSVLDGKLSVAQTISLRTRKS